MGLFRKREKAAWGATQSETALRRFAKARGVDLEALDADSLVSLMTAWFVQERPSDALETEGDGLLFEWGTFDFGQRSFSYGITRQITTVEDDESETWQLQVTLHYPPDVESVPQGNGSYWCFDPDELPSFEQAVATSAATPFATSRRPDRVEVTLDHV